MKCFEWYHFGKKYKENLCLMENSWGSDIGMDANKKKYNQEYTRTSYVEGNTVRKLNTVPDRREEQYEVAAPRRQDNRQTKTLSGINITSFLVLSIAIIATVFVCIDYIKVQSDINHMQKEIDSQQEKLITLTKDNDALEEMVKVEYNLDYVYHMAVEELGMVYPNDNTVITYKGSDIDYVRQYEEIPE